MSGEPNIIVVGTSTRAAAFSALRAGMRPYAIDLFADSDLVDVCPAIKIQRYPQDFEQALAKAPQAPWIYTGGLENYTDLVERMAALRPLYGNGADVLRKVRSPELLTAFLADSRFEMPEIRTLPPSPDSSQMWLRKPRRSSGGLGICRADADMTSANGQNWYYQRYIAGESSSAVYLAKDNGCELLGVTRQSCGVPEIPEVPFLYGGSATVQEDWEYLLGLKDLGESVAKNFGLRGLFNIDFVGGYSVEINPRYSASIEILEHTQARNFLTMHVAAFDAGIRGEKKCWVSKRPRHVAKRIVYATSDCIVTPYMERLRKSWNIERLLPCLADVPRNGDRIHRGQPVATVIVEGASDQEVQRLLEERVTAVQRTLLPV